MRNGNRRACQGDVCVRTLAARTRHPVARAMLVFLITVAMIWPVGIAYGVVITELPDSELLWGVSYPETDYPNLKFYTNYGSNRYEALGEMLAGEGGSSAWPALTSDQRAYLSNPETGGAFYTLAQQLVSFDDIDNVADALEVPTPIYWWVVNVGLYTVDTGQWQNPQWLNNLWYLVCTQEDIEDAIQAVEDVLSGDVGGGGESAPGTESNPDYGNFNKYIDGVSLNQSINTTIRVFKVYPASITSSSPVDNLQYSAINEGMTTKPRLYMTNNAMNQLITLSQQNDVIISPVSYSSTGFTFYIFVLTPNTQDIYLSNNNYYLRSTSTIYMLNQGYHSDLFYEGSKISQVLQTSSVTTGKQSISSPVKIYGFYWLIRQGMFITDEPTVPPTNWPDPTPTPVPPTSPTVPVAPIVNNTNNYTQNTYNTTNVDTSGDVTALLQKILQALDTHCVHLQNTIADELEINAKWITDTLDNDFDLLLQYLEDLADWLKAHWDFDYNVAPYDDSSILYWLRRIYNTLRTGGNTRPADPVIDPNGTGDWLQQLWQKFIDWMFGNAPLAVNELLSIFDVLRRKFPFSVPWDMAAVLTALVHEPVVPTVQLPCYAITSSGGIQQVGTYTISLQAYDTAWGSVRTVLFVVFAFELMKRTRSMLDLLKIGGR